MNWPILLADITDPPNFFLLLMGICAVMIAVAAVLELMPEREGPERVAGGVDKRAAKGERLKAKAEAKARQKADKAAAKAAKAAKKKKGKEKAAPADETSEPAAEEATAQSAAETLDFSEE